jgi:heavy metal efflux system protein
MLGRIVSLVLRQKKGVLFFSLLLLVFGLYSYFTLPIDAFPDVTNIQVEITGRADGLSALEIERSVTFPIEMATRGLPKVKQLRSITKFGLTLVTVVFEDDVDIYFARQLVFERLAEAKEKVPKNAEIEMGPIATAMGEIYQFTLAEKMPDDPRKKVEYLTHLRTLQEWVINPLLKSIPG